MANRILVAMTKLRVVSVLQLAARPCIAKARQTCFRNFALFVVVLVYMV